MTKSKIFLYLCVSFIFGIAVASFFVIPTHGVGIILIIGVSLIIVWWRHEWRLMLLGFCFIFGVLGIFHYSRLAETKNPNALSFYNQHEGRVILVGMVDDEPDIRSDNSKYEIEGETITIDSVTYDIEGKTLVTLKKYPEYSYGDKVEFKGQLRAPAEFPDFSYKEYLSRYEIYSVMYYPESALIEKGGGNFLYENILSVKKLFQKNIENVLPEPHASFLSGLLLGTRKQIPQDLIEVFNRTGTTHIIAISGYNISIIAVLLFNISLFLGLHRYWAFWLAVVEIMIFTVLTGSSASVVRAAVMGIFVLTANHFGRLSQATRVLVISAAIMLVVNPKLLRFDIGFQLSFLATLGLVIFSPILEKKFQEDLRKEISFSDSLENSFFTTLSAQVLVLPVLAYNFGRISLISPVANVLLLPLIPFTMLIGFIAGTIGFIWMPLAKLVGYLVWVLLQYEIWLMGLLAKIPSASIEIGRFGWWWVLVYYIVIIFVYQKLKRKSSKITV